MMACSFTGRCAMRFSRLLIIGLAALVPYGAMAAPSQTLSESIAEALATAERAWADTTLPDGSDAVPFDEQIFTEISPILDSPNTIKLPEDQLLSD